MLKSFSYLLPPRKYKGQLDNVFERKGVKI